MILTVKRNDEAVLVVQASVTDTTNSVIVRCCELYNTRNRLKRLIDAANDIATHGLMKPESEHGYSIEELEALNSQHSTASSSSSSSSPSTSSEPLRTVERNGQMYIVNPDPTGRRTGERPMDEIVNTIQQTLDTARALVTKEYIAAGNQLSLESVYEVMRNIGGALTIAYPMGLPEWEPVKDILENKEDLTGTAASRDVMTPEDAALWWAGKELVPGKIMSEFVGKNDKTKVIVKLQKKSQGAPVREPPMDERAQREMMAYYYKKQEEHKKLLENADEEYINSSWANPKSLKSHFNGTGNVSWRPS